MAGGGGGIYHIGWNTSNRWGVIMATEWGGGNLGQSRNYTA